LSCCGKKELIQDAIPDLKTSGFNLKIENSLKDYLSYCVVIENSVLKLILMLQPHPINNFQAKFGRQVCNKRDYKSPGTPRFKIVCPDDDDDDDNVIDMTFQVQFESAVGMLLYQTKYFYPDLYKIVR
jgi:hypothetical protein